MSFIMEIYGRTFSLEIKACHQASMFLGGVAAEVAAIASSVFAYQGVLPPHHIGTAVLIAGGGCYVTALALSILGLLALGVGTFLVIKLCCRM